MRTILTIALVPISLWVLGCQQPHLSGYAGYGAPVETDGALTLSEAVALATEDGSDPVSVKAEVGEVCQSKGCWAILTDGKNKVRIRFTTSEQCIDGFLLPRNCAGHTIYAHGRLTTTMIPQDEARHYAREGEKSEAEIEAIVGPQPEISMVATGVMLSDKDKLDPPVK